MGLLSAKQDEDVMAEINITPFTDVLLVLLIIFMILASLITPPGFQKDLPKSSPTNPTNPNPNKKFIDVEVNDKGVIYVDNTRTDDKGIYRVMADTRAKRGVLHISITADAKAPYGVILTILDAARDVGNDDVGFVTS